MSLLLPLSGFYALPHSKLSSLFNPSTLHTPHTHFTVSAFSANIPRIRKKAKSNDELCIDLLEFASDLGLPQGHVPSMKELLQHGRKDLANIVRRRGYKLIKELLEDSKLAYLDEPSQEESSAVTMVETSYSEGEKGQDQKLNRLSEEGFSSCETSVEGSLNSSASMNSDCTAQDHTLTKSSMTASLWEKVTNFIEHGDLDLIDQDVQEAGPGNLKQQAEHACPGKHGATVLNGSVKREHLNGDTILSIKGETQPDVVNELNEKTSGRENEVEIKHLKFMLHQKELELSRLKEQIEKEKLALSALQSKAEEEISKANKVRFETDAELIAAEGSLSGLKEVEIEYIGDGEVVKVTGSFNGWHHQLEMEPSSSADSLGSRKFKVWRIVLWLYPGNYEMKFIVDGHWTIDPRIESVTSGCIQNNILRVER